MAFGRLVLAGLLLVSLGACSVPGPQDAPDGIHDPYETTNRKIHAFNRAVDERILSGAGAGYAEGLPKGVQTTVSNVADTLTLPQTIANQILQGRLGQATTNTVRLAVNATLGFGGMADVATDLGMGRDESDFGETLYVWGVPEGAYMELPILGPSTERDTVGEIVDIFTNPLDFVLTREARRWATVTVYAAKVGERGQFGDTVDSVLYESADSYAQLRLIYLQNRRFELGDTSYESAEDSDPLALDTEGF